MNIFVPYGRDGSLSVAVPDANLIGVYRPRTESEVRLRGNWPDDLTPGTRAETADETAAMEQKRIAWALDNPVESLTLEDMIVAIPTQARRYRVAIGVDDFTRPTPTRKALLPLLARLEAAGVRDDEIVIIFATGSHRAQTDDERAFLVGVDVLARYRCVDHDAYDTPNLVDLGTTRAGTPVVMNRLAVEAGLRLLIGFVKPHCMAGYAGGGKTLLPGMCSIETINVNHGFVSTAHPRSLAGVIEGNPIRADIEEVSDWLGATFILNMVVNNRKEVLAAYAGHVVAAHRKAVAVLDQLARVAVPETADIVIGAASFPTDNSLYQNSNVVMNIGRVERPIIKPGGTIIMSGRCPEGIGTQAFYDLVRTADSPAYLLECIAKSPTYLKDQYVAQMWAIMNQMYRIIVVSEGISDSVAAQMWVRRAPDLDTALAWAVVERGAGARVAVLPEAAYTIAERPA